MKCLNGSVLTTAAFELVEQFYHATEFGNVAQGSGNVFALRIGFSLALFFVPVLIKK